MKTLLYVVVFCILTSDTQAQNIDGKWYGKLTQGPGAFSELYSLNLNLIQNNRNVISGDSYAFIPKILDARLGLSGTITDSIRLRENINDIRQERIPYGWVLCIKQLVLSYYKVGSTEYLQGTWSGVSKDDGTSCIPGKIVLARSNADLDTFFSGGGFENPIPEVVPQPLAEFTPTFSNTAVSKVTELEVSNTSLQIQLSDYLNVDNDTVSVYLNRKLLAKNLGITKRPVRIDFNLENISEPNEILLFAENLGKIPPNTSLMVIVDGDKKHQVKIESDKQKTAAIYIRFKSETPKK